MSGVFCLCTDWGPTNHSCVHSLEYTGPFVNTLLPQTCRVALHKRMHRKPFRVPKRLLKAAGGVYLADRSLCPHASPRISPL